MERLTLELEDVSFRYRNQPPILANVELRLESGLVLLVGPNGSGKTTLLRLMAGVEAPAEGRLRLRGRDLWEEEIEARQGMAYLPEHPEVTPYASVDELLTLVAGLRAASESDKKQAIARAGLDRLLGRSIRELSQGQRRRVLLAAAWIGRNDLLLLDEPFEGMDRAIREEIRTWILEVAEGGGLVIVATHEFDELLGRATLVLGVQAERVVRFDLPTDAAERRGLVEALARGRGNGDLTSATS